MTRVRTMLAVVVVATLAAGAPAGSALDLTGTWEGRQTCKGIEEGEKDRFSCCSTLRITQSGDAVNIRLTPTAGLYFGRVTAFDKHPHRGAVIFAACGTDSTLPEGSEMVFADVSVDPKVGSVKGNLRGSGPFLDDTDVQLSCTWHYKRVDTADPLVPSCP